MKLPYALAQGLIITAVVVAWMPTINSWPYYTTAALTCWGASVAMLAFPFLWDKYGAGINYA